MTAAQSQEDDIPLLTDVVQPGTPAQANTAHLETTLRLYTLAQPSPGQDPPGPEPLPSDPAPVAPDEAWLEELSLRVQSRVLAGLTARIDPIVEQRLRESLTDLLEQVLAGMTAELKVTAKNILRDAVAQAVAAELTQLHSERNVNPTAPAP